MREAVLRNALRKTVTDAAMRRAIAIHDAAFDAARDAHWEAHTAAGGSERDWRDPHPFDRTAARECVDALTDGALSNDPREQAAAYQALTEMGVSLADLMGDAYAEAHGHGQRHDSKIQELERRRREVMRDYAAIQKARPIDHAKAAGDVEDAVLVSP